jgi:hypothetical protein
MLVEIEKLIKIKIPREELEGFAPLNNLPSRPEKPHKSSQRPSKSRSNSAKTAHTGNKRSNNKSVWNKQSRKKKVNKTPTRSSIG